MPITPSIPDPSQKAISQELFDQLLPLRHLLMNSGYVQKREEKDRVVSYRLRYREPCEDRGHVVYRSLPLGSDPAVGEAVEALIFEWREPVRKAKADAKKRRMNARIEWAEKRVVLALVPGGEDRKLLAGRSYEKARREGPLGKLKFLHGSEYLQPGKQGRRRLSRLW